jgi:hypothetical protein
VLNGTNLPLSESPIIEVRTIKKANLDGGILIDGFPSGGLTNSIASMCFMKSLRNELISVLMASQTFQQEFMQIRILMLPFLYPN